MVSIHGICPLVLVEKTYPSRPFLRGNSEVADYPINHLMFINRDQHPQHYPINFLT
jgi:hypothetical protein